MMAATIAGPLAALVAGLITSIHCAGMCGPLACAACTKSQGSGSAPAALVYHGTRILSYGVLGLLAGSIGRAVSDVLLGGGTRWLTWAFVAFFVIVATGLDKRLRIPVAGAWMANALGGQDAVFARAAMLGTLTPFIPCGPLYLMLAASALAGSAWAGAAVMAAFAVGTVPLILGIQSQLFRMGARISPVGLERLRRALAAASVAVLIYRGLGDPAVMCQ